VSNNSWGWSGAPPPPRGPWLRMRNSSAPRYDTKHTDTTHEMISAAAVTAKIAKVYSPVTDFAMPIGRKPAAVISVPVSIGIAVTS